MSCLVSWYHRVNLVFQYYSHNNTFQHSVFSSHHISSDDDMSRDCVICVGGVLNYCTVILEPFLIMGITFFHQYCRWARRSSQRLLLLLRLMVMLLTGTRTSSSMIRGQCCNIRPLTKRTFTLLSEPILETFFVKNMTTWDISHHVSLLELDQANGTA
jgi:hypothetical protein